MNTLLDTKFVIDQGFHDSTLSTLCIDHKTKTIDVKIEEFFIDEANAVLCMSFLVSDINELDINIDLKNKETILIFDIDPENKVVKAYFTSNSKLNFLYREVKIWKETI